MYRINRNDELTINKISKYIEHNQTEVARREMLMDYYKGKSKILSKTYDDPTKPCNRIVNPYAQYITDIATAYFLGNPVQYRSINENLEAAYRDICAYNDEAAENVSLAKNASICGESYELLWLDSEGNIRFKALDPLKAIPIYDDTLEEELVYFIRYYEDEDIETGNKTTFIEVYTDSEIRKYKNTVGNIQLLEIVQHPFKAVPIVVFKNNDELIGDFETVISLIDAYDSTISGELDDMSYFTDAYLALYGMMGTDESDIAAMKKNRVLLMDENAKAEWLTKNVNDSHEANVKNIIDEAIHKFSTVPNMSDVNFVSNSSGVAIRYKLLGLENKTSKKESAFKKGLQRRIEIICQYLYILGGNYDFRDIEIIFTRNLPNDINEIASVLNQVGHLLSEETQLSLLPIDVDYSAEQERKRREREEGYDEYYIGIGDNSGDVDE